MSTPLENKISILSELWSDYKGEEEFADFIEYNDLGLPLAFAIDGGIVQTTEIAERFISETFDLLLEGLNLEDTGFESLNDVLGH